MPNSTTQPLSDAAGAQPGLRELIWSDYAALGGVNAVHSEMGERTTNEGDVPSPWRAPRRFLLNASLRAALLIRLTATSTPATYWFWRSVLLWLHSCEVMRGAVIGPGLRLPHPFGITIANRVVIGSNVTIAHCVTLGADLRYTGQPTIGDNVRILSGSVVAGPVSIGDGALIGANCVVLEDVEKGGRAVSSGTTIVGPAARLSVLTPGAGWRTSAVSR